MWHLNRPTFDRALQRHAIESGIDLIEESSHAVVSFNRQTDYWEVHLASPEGKRVVEVGSIVDATGKSSCFARLMGSRRIMQDHLVAVSCICKRSGAMLPLLIEPVCTGWWYSFGLPQGQLLVALVTDPKLVKLSAEMRESFWDAMLGEALYTRKRIGPCENVLHVSSAESARLDRMSGEGWLAIGDAAMSFDPLSSHGLCSAIEQAIDAAELVSVHGYDEAPRVAFETRRKDLFEQYRVQQLDLYQNVWRFSEGMFWQNRMLR
jgi:flavin-dependent dehydrogenase